MSSTAEKLAANDMAGVGSGRVESDPGASDESVAEALEAAALAEKQDALDAENRSTPDYPDGAADDEPAGEHEDVNVPQPEDVSDDGSPVSGYPQPEDERPQGTPSELAERLRNASGIAHDEAEAAGDDPASEAEREGELPGMPAPKLTSKAGGRKPDYSEFKLNGRSLDLGPGTQFDKGETVYFRIGVTFPAVNFVDKEDKETGQVTETIRRHVGKIVSYELEDVEG